MFDHVVFGTSDYEASRAFFLKALEPIGIAIVSEGPLGIELTLIRQKSGGFLQGVLDFLEVVPDGWRGADIEGGLSLRSDDQAGPIQTIEA